ncbi:MULTISPECIES: hypothetical protein [Halomonas]|nr:MULTISPECIES: hypothetical protein [Halomonas]
MSENFEDWLKRHDIAQIDEETRRKMLDDADEDISFEDNKD